MINLTTKTTRIYFDEHGMPVVQGDKESINDSVGRLVLMGIAYGFIPEIKKALESCLDFTVLYRHPTNKVQTSRDHTSYFCIYRKLIGVSIPKFPFMRGLYLWMHSLTGNRLAKFFYYLIYIPGALIGNTWLRICRWAGRIGKEWSNEDWIAGGNPNAGTQMLYDRTKWQKFWAWIIFQTIPAYPFHNKGWQLYVMPDSKRKERLKRILLSRIGISNIMLRLLFEPKVIYNAGCLKGTYKLVTQQEIDNYPNMISYRPGVYLDETCRRTIREMTEIESSANTYERDLILFLWDKRFKGTVVH